MGSARWFTSAGLLIFVVGVVDLIWTQTDIGGDTTGFTASASYRWQVATGPLFLVAIGVLICAAAQILAVVQARTQTSDGPDTPDEGELSDR